ncbi:MAG TPA: 16S rRNA (guanine(966)-N(2))-methyltransferase RsmD [Candidatus Aminicenantes bacterium]|nr:16S rRNA (guanine(966)-N(2))-methyltransferase RsmD [Candidatus Aminicenantes bacterium]
MLRIIGGAYKGRRLRLVSSASVRPMQDKVKGALFNILGDRVKGAVCLDGFAGTGSVGLEALSRGAARCVFVDEFLPAVKVIRRNVEACGADEKAVVLRREFNRAVIDLAKQGVRFDLVFLDPPYRLLEERNPLRVLRKRDAVKPGGLVVLRHHYRVEPRLGDFRLERRAALGDDVLALFVRDGTTLPAGGGAAGAAPAPPKGPKAGPKAGLSRPRHSLKMKA